MSIRARRRAEHAARLTPHLNRGRGNRRQLSLVPKTPNGDTSTARQAPATTVWPLAPASAVQQGDGRLVSTWTVNESGHLVMVWSLEPVVEAAPAIRLSRIRLNAAVRQAPDVDRRPAAGGAGA